MTARLAAIAGMAIHHQRSADSIGDAGRVSLVLAPSSALKSIDIRVGSVAAAAPERSSSVAG